MKKTMQCKSAPEIEFSLDGGASVSLRFNVQMISNLQEDVQGGLKEFLKKSPAEMAALVVYAAGKDYNENFTREKARALVSEMDFKTVNDILDTFNESMGVDASDPTQKKMLAEILKEI